MPALPRRPPGSPDALICTIAAERRVAGQTCLYIFHADEVEILRRGKEIVLREKSRGLGRAFELLASLPEDLFAPSRVDLPPQKRRAPLLSPG